MMTEAQRHEWTIQRGDLKAATAARREFTKYVRSKHASEDASYDATLIFGELVSNAVKCARHSVRVEVLEDTWTSLRVVDDGDCFDQPTMPMPPVEAQSGRGLSIVNQLALNLDVAVSKQRCEVTAVLPIRS